MMCALGTVAAPTFPTWPRAPLGYNPPEATASFHFTETSRSKMDALKHKR